MEATDSGSTPGYGYFREFLTELHTPIFLLDATILIYNHK